MAKDTIEAIREAELASVSKEKEAKAKAAQIVEDARAAARTAVSGKLSKLKEEDEVQKASAEKEGTALIEKAEQEAASEIQALRERAAGKEAAAIDAVLKKLTA